MEQKSRGESRKKMSRLRNNELKPSQQSTLCTILLQPAPPHPIPRLNQILPDNASLFCCAPRSCGRTAVANSRSPRSHQHCATIKKKNQRVSLSLFTQYVNPSSRHNHAMSVFCSTLIDSFTVKIDVQKLQFIVKYSKVFTVKRRKRSFTKQSFP